MNENPFSPELLSSEVLPSEVLPSEPLSPKRSDKTINYDNLSLSAVKPKGFFYQLLPKSFNLTQNSKSKSENFSQRLREKSGASSTKLNNTLEFFPDKSFYIYNFTQLFSSGSKTGGVTGSLCVQDKAGNKFQLKPTFSKQGSVVRKLKAHCDAENLGEFIAAGFAKAFFGKSSNSIPNVHLLYDPEAKEIGIASEYIKNTLSNLNDFLRAKKEFPGSIKHLSLTQEKTALQQGKFNLDELSILEIETNQLKEELAQAITVSALLGDHDIHHGNMIVTNDKHIARIDFGHAFNDLINTLEIFGGKQRYYDRILDFFNRSRIAGVNKASKLHHCYPGLRISKEMVEALRTFGAKSRTTEAFTEQKEHIIEALQGLYFTMDSKEDVAGLNNLKNSMLVLYRRTDGQANLRNKTLKDIISIVLEHLEKTIIENCKSASKLADKMEFQLKIDQMLLKEEKFGEHEIEDLKAFLEKIFAEDHVEFTHRAWLKMPNEEKEHSGNLKTYIISRMKHLAQAEKDPAKQKETLSKIIENAEKLDKIFKIDQFNDKSPKIQSPLSSNNQVLCNNLRNFLGGEGSESLLEALDLYQKNHLLRKEEKSFPLSMGMSSTHKTEAVKALIAYIKFAKENEKPDSISLENLIAIYGKAFNDGHLQEIIQGHIKDKNTTAFLRNSLSPNFS